MTEASIRSNVQVIAWLNIVLGVLNLVAGVVAFFMMGSFGIAIAGTQDPGSGAAGAAFGGFGAILASVALLIAIPSFIVGTGLIRYAPWSRVACIVLSVLHLANASTLGLSTLVGIYSLIILLQSECSNVFRN